MSKGWKIASAILMWCAIAGYVGISTWYAHERRKAVTVSHLRIAVTDTAGLKVVTAAKVMKWLSDGGIEPIGVSIDRIDTRLIERQLGIYPEVKHVSAWTDLDGNLNVRIEPRIPIMRVRTNNGYRFWLFRDGYILPERGDFTAYVPVVTGVDVPFPFSPSDEGSYAQIKVDNFNDYLARYTAIARERALLKSRQKEVWGQIGALEESHASRWWSQRRRTEFEADKELRLTELNSRAAEIPKSMASLNKIEGSLREKEKKSYKSHNFWYKLANFAEFVGNDRFWSDQIVQIVVEGELLELIPRAGDHVIELGELDGTEIDRLANLRAFYDKGLWYDGWQSYSRINIKYKNQVVCTK